MKRVHTAFSGGEMSESRAFVMTGKHLKDRCKIMFRICLPVIISFFCIGLFLVLSFIIIEGYSVSEMMQEERELTNYKISDH